MSRGTARREVEVLSASKDDGVLKWAERRLGRRYWAGLAFPQGSLHFLPSLAARFPPVERRLTPRTAPLALVVEDAEKPCPMRLSQHNLDHSVESFDL